MTRHSAHRATATFVSNQGTLAVDPEELQLSLSEANYPYGTAQLTFPLPADEATLALSDPRARRLRLSLDLVEQLGDPVNVYEITAEHGGDMVSLTAMFTGLVAAVTSAYYTAWNSGGITGTALRANLAVVSRIVDHEAATVTVTASTDEALAEAYRLVALTSETSGTFSVRDTVNFALAKIGAALAPGDVDATIVEPAAIVWLPGTSAWEYIRNVCEPAGLVVRCDQRRRWTLSHRDDLRPEQVILSRHLTVTEDTDLGKDEWADGVVVKYEWADPDTGAWTTRYDTASTTAEPVKVVLLERRTPYPGPGAAEYWLRRFTGRGRVFTLTQVCDYSMRPAMQFATRVPQTPQQLGHIETISWRLPDAQMSITTAAATVVRIGAWALYPADATWASLVGTWASQLPGSEED
jgi:hypothetical protein